MAHNTHGHQHARRLLEIERPPGEKYYLYSVWGDTRKGDRNACMEDFDDVNAAGAGLKSLLEDHPDAVWMMIRGEEVARGPSFNKLSDPTT